jgi:hypothetical protein
MVGAASWRRRGRWTVGALLTLVLLVPVLPAMADDTAVDGPAPTRSVAPPEGFVVTPLAGRGDSPAGSVGLGNSGTGWRFDRGPSNELVVAGSVGVDEVVVGVGESQKLVPQWWGPRLSGSVTQETVLITRWLPDGSLDWARRIGSPFTTRPTRVRIDPRDGAFYLSGTTEGSIDFGDGAPVTGVPGCSRCWSGFLAKFSPDGDLLWQVTFRPGAGISYPQGLDVAPNGDVVLSFEWMDHVTLPRQDTQTVLVRSATASGSARQVTLEPTETEVTPEGAKWHGGTRTTALVRYAPDGGLLWARVLSGSQNGGNGDLAVLDDGRIAVTTTLWGTTRLLDGPAVVEPPRGHVHQGFYIAMLTPEADRAEWVSVVGGKGNAQPLDLVQAADGSLLIGAQAHEVERIEFTGPGGSAGLDLANPSEPWAHFFSSSLFNLGIDGEVRWGLKVSRWTGVLTIEPLEGVASRLTDMMGQTFHVGPPLPPADPLPNPGPNPGSDPDVEPPFPPDWDVDDELLGPDEVRSVSRAPQCAPGVVSTMNDVPSGAFFAPAVRCLVHQRITNGIAGQPNRYGPDLVVTRAQMATFLWRLAGQPTPRRPNAFTDVPAGTWFTAAATWLAERGISTGVNGDPTRFAPDRPVTRSQMAAFLWRFANSPVVPAGRTADVPRSAYYAKAVDWLSARGITTGVNGDPTRFAPDMTVTRGQMAAFLFRFGVNRGLWSP